MVTCLFNFIIQANRVKYSSKRALIKSSNIYAFIQTTV